MCYIQSAQAEENTGEYHPKATLHTDWRQAVLFSDHHLRQMLQMPSPNIDSAGHCIGDAAQFSDQKNQLQRTGYCVVHPFHCPPPREGHIVEADASQPGG